MSETLPDRLEPVPAGLPAALVSRRPDLVAAERRLAAAGARVDEARRALYPRISLSTSLGTSSDELKDLANGNFSVWTLAGNLAQPIFQGGRILAGIDLAEARQRELAAAYVGTALEAFREVESALARSPLLERQHLAVQSQAAEAAAARDEAENRYDRGLVGLVTLLEAQRRALEAESQLIAIQRQRLDNRLDLILALGGDYSDLTAGSPEEPSPEETSP